MSARAAVAAGLGLVCALGASPAVGGRLTDYASLYAPGSIVISQSARKLYLILDDSHAIAYPVAVARRGKEWLGSARVAGKFIEPDWAPPDMVRRDHPGLPDTIPGGSPANPMGARAILLDRDEIAIHGTNRRMRASIGTAASYGCIRMLNEDVIDLFERVEVGAPVIMRP